MVTTLVSILPEKWKSLLSAEFEKPYFKKLNQFIQDAYNSKTIYPPFPDLFNALKLTSPENIKVLILGQDPYHGANQANGLSFSVNQGVKIPPSLKNIFKELNSDLGTNFSNIGDLTKWSQQGVLLLNNVMSVEEALPNSHQNNGWEQFTTAILKAVAGNNQHIVFMLWGKNAQTKVNQLDLSNHHVLQAPHPSPLSAHRGFIGCGHFSIANKILKEQSLTPIDWQLDD